MTAPAVCLLIVSVLAGLMNFFVLAFGFSVEADPAEFRDQLQIHMNRNPNLTPQQRQQLATLGPQCLVTVRVDFELLGPIPHVVERFPQ